MSNLLFSVIAALGLLLGFERPLIAQVHASQETSSAEVYVAPRELIILKGGADTVWGTWIVAVMNRSTKPQELSFLAHLPKETKDFRPEEGLDAKDIHLTDEGVVIKKTFAPGVNVIGLYFLLGAPEGKSAMTLRATRPIPEMLLMTPAGLLTLNDAALSKQADDVQDGQRYSVYTLNKPVAVGEELAILIEGIPQGRTRLWGIGAISAAVLVFLAVFLSWKTKPVIAKAAQM